MSWQLWLAFFAAAWAISLSPGPGALAVMSASRQHGFARGWFAIVGLVLGFWTQLVVVAAGVGAIIATSALAFAVVKWLGVAYLVYLGIRQWRAPPLALEAATVAKLVPAARGRIVAEAWLLNAVNPKGTAFMLAVVPQFLAPSEPLFPRRSLAKTPSSAPVKVAVSPATVAMPNWRSAKSGSNSGAVSASPTPAGIVNSET